MPGSDNEGSVCARRERGRRSTGTFQPWHAFARSLLDAIESGSGVGVAAAVTRRAAQGTGLGIGTVSSMVRAARFVRSNGYDGPVLASVDAVLALRSLQSRDRRQASRIFEAVMSGSVGKGDIGAPAAPRETSLSPGTTKSPTKAHRNPRTTVRPPANRHGPVFLLDTQPRPSRGVSLH